MRYLSCVKTLIALCAIIMTVATASAAQDATPIEVRLVVVTAFEIGEDTGDKPGEFQSWAKELPETLPFPAGFRHLRYDPKRKVLAISTGTGTNRAATSTLALGLDPRFDLTHSYWLVAAIAGVNPDEASIGSAAWIGDVVDSDRARIIDPREIPAGWQIGYIPGGRSAPYQLPLPADTSTVLFPLNKALRDWAFALTRTTALPDSEALRHIRAHYVGYPNAQKPPFVLTGEEVSGQGYWQGKLLNAHYERWTDYWTSGKGRFVMTAMEDSGVINAIQRLEQVGRADPHRILVLRTGSDYSMQYPGEDALTSLLTPDPAGLRAALDAAHTVGSQVVNEITAHWDLYRNAIPGGVQD
jgi:purine nucleoside permease